MIGLRAAVAIGVFAAVAGVSLPAIAAQPSGQVVAVTPAATASGGAGERTLAVQAPVYTGDVIATDRGGEAQVLFADDTRLVVGPNSNLTIDRFVFQNKASAKTFSIGMAKGAFRFITGKSAKAAYTISTPTATIGVRGTEFDVSLGADGSTNLALYGGTVRICDKSGRCADVTGACSVAIVAPDQDLQNIKNVYQRSALLESKFRYAFNQSWLREDFRVQSRNCAVQNNNPNSSPGGIPSMAPGGGDGGGGEGGGGL
jgi:hypothetical protein